MHHVEGVCAPCGGGLCITWRGSVHHVGGGLCITWREALLGALWGGPPSLALKLFHLVVVLGGCWCWSFSDLGAFSWLLQCLTAL